MTQLIIVSRSAGVRMAVEWRITNEDMFTNFVECYDLKLSFNYEQFLDLNGDYTGEITRKLNRGLSSDTEYLALVA